MSDLIITSLQMLVFFFQGYLLQYFFGSFLESRFFSDRKNGMFVVGVYGVLALGMDLCLPPDYGSIRIFSKLMLNLLIVLAIALCFYKSVRAITIFLIVTFIAVSEVCFFIAYMILQMGPHLTDFWLHLLDKGYFVSEEKFMDTVELTLTILMLLMYVAFIALTYYFLRKIVKSFREKEYAIHNKELFFILTPGLVGLLLCVLLRLIMITVEDEVPRLLYDKYPILMWLVPAIMFLSLMSILYGVQLFQDMIDLNRERSSRIILEKQIAGMQEHVKEVEYIYSGVRSMKHDMKNTLAVIMQLASGKEDMENTGLQEYLSELNQTFNKLDIQFKTGNTVVDTLLNMKYHEVIRTIPDIQICAEKLLFSDSLNIQSYDIGVIIGNALDNAMDACRKLKEEQREAQIFIRLSSFIKGKMLFLEVENSFNGEIIKRKQSEFPATDKADKKAHGMGLMNIKNTAEKYHGAVDWSVDNKVFTLTVMMKNERSNNNEYL